MASMKGWTCGTGPGFSGIGNPSAGHVELTQGRSLEANQALARNNASLAAEIAVELAKL